MALVLEVQVAFLLQKRENDGEEGIKCAHQLYSGKVLDSIQTLLLASHWPGLSHVAMRGMLGDVVQGNHAVW